MIPQFFADALAHLGGGQTVASLVKFIDGLPFKPGYRRFKIRNVKGVDDFRSIHEVVSRRFKRLYDEQDVFPDTSAPNMTDPSQSFFGYRVDNATNLSAMSGSASANETP